jgi:chorismate mutase-like protein
VLSLHLDYTDLGLCRLLQYREGRLPMGLNELRERLDTIDEQVVSLLSERAQVVVQVAAFKLQHNLPVYMPEREVFIIERLRALNPGPLGGDTLERIYRTILEEMRKFESEYYKE